MANDQAKRGLVPVRHLAGAPLGTSRFVADTTTGIGKGDVLALASDGKVDRWLAASGLILGVAAESKATGVAATIAVWHDRGIVYEAMTTASRAQTHIGNWVVPTAAAYNATLGLSNYSLGAVSSATFTATYPLMIVGLANKFNSDGSRNAFGSYAKLEVVITFGIGEKGI